jgi:hypothetical protein
VGEVRDDVLGVTFHFDGEGRLHRDPGQGPAVVHDTGTEEWWDHGRRTTFVDDERDLVTDERNNDCIPSVRGVPYLGFPTYVGGTPPQYRNGTPSFKVTMYTNRGGGLYAFHPFDGMCGLAYDAGCVGWSAEGVLNDCLKTVKFCGLRSQVGAYERRIVRFADDFAHARGVAARVGARYIVGAETRNDVIGWDPRRGVHPDGGYRSVLCQTILEPARSVVLWWSHEDLLEARAHHDAQHHLRHLHRDHRVVLLHRCRSRPPRFEQVSSRGARSCVGSRDTGRPEVSVVQRHRH